MRILVANLATAPEASASGEFMRSVLGPITRRNMLLAAPDAEFVMRFANDGEASPAFAACKYLAHVNRLGIYAALLNAQQEGFDGAIVACFGDPYLNEIRAHIDIPVVGFGESSILLAAMVGKKMGVVAPSEAVVEKTRQQVEAYGLGRRLAGIIPGAEKPEQYETGLTHAGHGIECFIQEGRALIAQGADVLITACGLLSPALRMAPGMQHVYPNGLTHVDDVPVIDVMGASVSMVSALIAARHAGSGWKAPIDAAKLAAGNAELSASAAKISFWDC